jgi:hypothetical protein
MPAKKAKTSPAITKPTLCLSNTTVAKCRYGNLCCDLWNTWQVLWFEAESDYQGWAKFLLIKNGEFIFYEYTYGSCSGCDTWEDKSLSPEQIQDEMKKTAMEFKNISTFMKWIEMLEETGDEKGEAFRQILNTQILTGPQAEQNKKQTEEDIEFGHLDFLEIN